jgi:hypothetical protein
VRDFDVCDWCGGPYVAKEKAVWVKTALGFRRVHEDCKKAIQARGEEIPSERVFALNSEASNDRA